MIVMHRAALRRVAPLACALSALLFATPSAFASRRDDAAVQAINQQMAAGEARYRAALVKIANNAPDGQKEGDAALEDMEDAVARMSLDISTLQNLFTLSRGATVKQQLTTDFSIKGVVVSTSQATSNSPVTTVVIRCTSRPGAVFTFTRVVGQDESITYRGRILSRNNSDALDIVKVNNQYYLQKKNYNDIISE